MNKIINYLNFTMSLNVFLEHLIVNGIGNN